MRPTMLPMAAAICGRINPSSASLSSKPFYIHTVRDGKLTGRTYHVEDWMGASRQLNGR